MVSFVNESKMTFNGDLDEEVEGLSSLCDADELDEDDDEAEAEAI